MTTTSSFALRAPLVEAEFVVPDDGPVLLSALRPRDASDLPRRPLVSPYPLASVFTAFERQTTRMNPAPADSVLGRRLRYVSHLMRGSDRLEIRQADVTSRLELTTTVTVMGPAVRIAHTVTNHGADEVLLTSLSAGLFGFGESEEAIDTLDLTWGTSSWTAENRWLEEPLRALLPERLGRYGSDTATRIGRTSHGSWSTGSALPTGMLVDRASGAGLAWDLCTGGAWHWEVGQTATGGYLALHGPTDRDHGFAQRLAEGDSFEAPAVLIACSDRGPAGAIAALTDARRASRRDRPADRALPVIYNDFMNTLLGQPSTERLEPLIRAAGEVGAEVFCIDAGWFADPVGGDWWRAIGDWREAPGRFTGGLAVLMERIRSAGMIPGLWLEPEVVGLDSSAAGTLPRDAFFQRNGHLVVTQRRLQLDFRHAAARAHADAALDYVVGDLGAGYVKLDYNIDPGAGTDLGSDSPAAGLLGHVRAHRQWLEDARVRHPSVLFENCAAGAMRMDPELIALCDLQSTSDQPDFLQYPPIAASAPMSMPPERAGNWAYPAAGMSQDETAFSLVGGIIGRLYLSGFLDALAPAQLELVREAVVLAKTWRETTARAHPVWPLGLPHRDADHVALALDGGDEYLVALWSRGASARVTLKLPFPVDGSRQLFPATAAAWSTEVEDGVLTVEIESGPSACVLVVRQAKPV